MSNEKIYINEDFVTRPDIEIIIDKKHFEL
jgi:hypothetical protein